MVLELFKSLADPTRLRLLNILQQGEFTVQELIEILAMGQSRISRHLKILLDAGLLSVKREGTWAYYRLSPATPHCPQLHAFLLPELARLETSAADRIAIVSVLAARRQRSLSFFDRHARDWDRMARQLLPTPSYQEDFLAAIPRSQCLLEVGVGTGSLLPGLGAKSRQVIGVDHAPAMLNAARQRLAAAGLAHVELRLGEMEHLPVESASVDAAVLNMVLHHAPVPLTVLLELFRVLKPGGQIFVADLLRHQDEWTREKMADQWLGFTAEELSEWGESAGLEVVFSRTLAANRPAYTVLMSGMRKP